MPETYWTSKYVGRVGEATPRRGDTPSAETGLIDLGQSYTDLFRVGRDCWPTEAEAMADAERRRDKKIASLRKQIEKLEKTPIKVTRLSDAD